MNKTIKYIKLLICINIVIYVVIILRNNQDGTTLLEWDVQLVCWLISFANLNLDLTLNSICNPQILYICDCISAGAVF